MKTAKILLDGEERLLSFSMGVLEAAAEKYGDVDKFFEALEAPDQTTQIRTVIWALAQMMAAGAEYAELKHIPAPKPLGERELRYLCDVGELLALRAKVKETITAGSAREVEADPPKNGEATSDGKTGDR